MGVPLIDNFIINSNEPIDTRIIASSSVERDAIEYKYDGLKVFQLDTRKTYTWNLSSYTASGITATSWDIGESGIGNITGAGSPNYVAKFDNTGIGLTNSSIYSVPPSYGVEVSQKIGIGGIPLEAFQVNSNYLSSAIGATSQPFVVHKGGGVAGPSTAIGENWYWSIGPGDNNFNSNYGSSIIAFNNGGFNFKGRVPGSGQTLVGFVDISNTGVTNFNNYISMTSSASQPGFSYGTMYVDSNTNRWKVMEAGNSRFISRTYEVYTTILTQVGTSNPTEILLESTIGAGAWTRVGVGTYNLTVSNGFSGIAPEITGFVDPSTTSSVYYGKYISNNVYQIKTLLSAGSPTLLDNVLNSTLIEIKVWKNITTTSTTTTTTTLAPGTTTTSTTTTTTLPGTTTTTTSTTTTTTTMPTATLSISFAAPFFGGPTWRLILSSAVSQNLTIDNLVATGYSLGGCSSGSDVDSFQQSGPGTITSGTTFISVPGSLESNPGNESLVRSQDISLIGGSVGQARIYIGAGGGIVYNNGDTFMVGPTLVTLSISGCTSVPQW